MSNDWRGLHEATRDREGLLDRWIDQVVRRSWTLAGRDDELRQLRQRCGAIADALKATLDGEPSASLGAVEWREPVQLLSFTAGWMAGVGLPVGGALAVAHGLREAAGGGPDALFDSFATVVTEAYVAAVGQQATARHRSVIEKSQVVCLLGDQLPCLFLVGDPDRQALDDAIGRLMMVAVMRQAEVMIVDASGLVAPEVVLPEALRILADHRSEPPPRLLLSSVTAALAERLCERGEHPAQMGWFDRLEQALAACAAGAGAR